MNKKLKKKIVNKYLSVLSAVFILSIFILFFIIFTTYKNGFKKTLVGNIAEEFSNIIEMQNKVHSIGDDIVMLENETHSGLLEATSEQIDLMEDVIEESTSNLEWLEAREDNKDDKLRQLIIETKTYYEDVITTYTDYADQKEYINALNYTVFTYNEKIANLSKQDSENSPETQDSKDKEIVFSEDEEFIQVYEETYELLKNINPPENQKQNHEKLLKEFEDISNMENFYQIFFNYNEQIVAQINNSLALIDDLNKKAKDVKKRIIEFQTKYKLEPITIDINEWKS
ncbi:MAG: hypothetical protein GF347_00125 [Candidatus Moranbacteria bacterium]|nr:hypothetical protein [Candidatus Moranbacteria bacterium]